MADLLIRDIDPRLKQEIEESAQRNRQSLSDETKALIRKGLSVPKDERRLGTLLAELVPPGHRGDDLVFEIKGDYPVPPDFE